MIFNVVSGRLMRRLLPLLCLLSFAATAAEVEEARRPDAITVTLDDNYPPYIFRNASGAIDGYLVDVWKLWEAKTGVRVELVATDWAKAQRLFAEGKADVIDTIFRTPERERTMDFSRPYAELPVPIFVHSGIGGITGIDNLRGFLVGVKNGDACAEHLDSAGVNTLALFDSYEAIVSAATAGRVRVFCLDEPPANYLLYRARADQDFRKAFVLYSGHFHRAVLKENAATLQLVQQGFDAISSAEYKRVQDKWMGTQLDIVPWGRYLAYALGLVLFLGIGTLVWSLLLRREVLQRTRQLRDERQRLRTLINTLPDLVWLKDPEGVYLACNAEFERLYGATEDEIVGRTDYDFAPRELADFFRAKDREAIDAGGSRRNEEAVVYASDGHHALLETIKTPMFDSAGQLVGVLGVARDITERRQADRVMQEAQERFRIAFQACPLAASIARATDGRFVDVNENYLRDFGWSREDVIGRTSVDIGLWNDIGTRLRWVDQLRQHGAVRNYEAEWRDRERQLRHVSISAAMISLSGEPHIFAYVADVGERKLAEESLRLAAKVFESTAEGILVSDPEGRILAVNRAFSEITGYAADEVLGRNPRLLRSGRHEPIFYQELWAALKGTGSWQGEIWNRRKNGEIFPNWETISAVRNLEGNVSHYVSVFSDISSVKRSQEALEFLAHHDPLTELPNRLLLRDRLEHALNRHRREQGRLAVIFVDLDRFKHINDTLGHSVGDEILRQSARAMGRELRASDTLARIGGDEFVILLEDEVSVRSVAAVANKLLAVFANPFHVGSHELHMTASIGVSLYPNDGDSIDALLMNADVAMYKAKEQGRNNFQFYEAEMGAGAFERLIVENALRGAVQRGELLLHYQPQFDLASGRLAGVEALVRWQHPELGLVPPGRFIQIAEEMGIIGEIGHWVLRESCRQIARWRADGFMVPRVAVNLSMQQLERNGVVDAVEACLSEYRLEAGLLELEVTESAIMCQTGRVLEALGGLRRLGTYLAIDDFGTGYSSLAYLRQLPVHRLKIDYSFVRDIGRDVNDEAIARAVIGLGHSLALEVVAEGVEREDQAEFLRREHCDVAQGFLYAMPMPPDMLEEGWRNGRFGLASQD